MDAAGEDTVEEDRKPTAERIRQVCEGIKEFEDRRNEARKRKMPKWLAALFADRDNWRKTL